jgi:hypothetical protein
MPAVESSAASGFRRALPAITPVSAAVAAAAALSAVIGTLGGDLRWLAALGAIIVRHGSIPSSGGERPTWSASGSTYDDTRRAPRTTDAYARRRS